MPQRQPPVWWHDRTSRRGFWRELVILMIALSWALLVARCRSGDY